MGMTIATGTAAKPERNRNALHFAALVGGNVALAVGTWPVRLADTGPVAAGFWRLVLAVPLLLLLARANRQPLTGFSRRTWLIMFGAGVFFALDIASWHVGIGMTRLGNATLFGNSGSLILMAWGVLALRRWPNRPEALALVAALGGSAILLGRSFEIDDQALTGDLFCLLAGFLYAFYILLLQGARSSIGSWTLLAWSSLAGAPVMLAIALLLGEPVWPRDWGPLVLLALGSQVVGQGLLVYALKHFSALVIGLALLTQPVVSVVVGWLVFGEVLGPLDGLGMVLVGMGLVLARGSEKPSTAT
jgi:drug/metabolite transporter (DMT)-like permease